MVYMLGYPIYTFVIRSDHSLCYMQRFLLLLCCGSISLFAQATGRLTGTVADPSGAKIADATVSIYLAGGKTAILTAKTSSEGLFDFPALRAELYDVGVEAPGFTRYNQARV